VPNGVNGRHTSPKNTKKKNAAKDANDDLHFGVNGSHGDEHVADVEL
jgi:hypothetical protein